jgi:hypothetical protein
VLNVFLNYFCPIYAMPHFSYVVSTSIAHGPLNLQ